MKIFMTKQVKNIIYESQLREFIGEIRGYHIERVGKKERNCLPFSGTSKLGENEMLLNRLFDILYSVQYNGVEQRSRRAI